MNKCDYNLFTCFIYLYYYIIKQNFIIFLKHFYYIYYIYNTILYNSLFQSFTDSFSSNILLLLIHIC